jgi:surfactin synthase thioesterase subunit
VTGTAPPHLIVKWQKRDVWQKAMVADNSPEYLVSLSRYVDNPEFLKLIIPRMRPDDPLLQSYRSRPTAPLNCPLTAFAARQDDFVYLDEISDWAEYTTGGFQVIQVDGDHWFLDRNRKQITTILRDLAAGIAPVEHETGGQPRMLLAPDP